MSVYFDYNATAPLRSVALEAMCAAYGDVGNPSSVHRPGRVAKDRMENAREQISRTVRCSADDLIFTSGGTESNNLAIRNAVEVLGVRSILIGAAEHPSNLIAARNCTVPVVELAVLPDGRIDMLDLVQKIAEQVAPFLVVVMAANNETGVIQPMAQIADQVHQAGGFLHVDAAQAFGKIPVNFAAMNADSMTLVSHKIGGPLGIGALVVRCGLVVRGQMVGGSQETGRRAGTSNVPAMVGFAAATAQADEQLDMYAKLAKKRDHLAQLLRQFAPDLVVFGETVDRLPNTLCCAVSGFAGQTQIMALDLAGYAVSAGSACSSGKVKASHVLQAMQVPEALSTCAIRISIGWHTTDIGIEGFANAWGQAYGRIEQERVA